MVRTMFIPGALRGNEAFLLFQSSLLKLRSAMVAAVWSKRQLFVTRVLCVLVWHVAPVFCLSFTRGS